MSDVKNTSSTFETIVKPIIVLTVICVITSALLAFTNSVTAPIIEAAELAAAQAAYQEVLPEADGFEDLTAQAPVEGVTAVMKATNGAGWCFQAEGKGYGGAVPVIISVDAEGNILAVKFMQNAESAGFGMKLWDGNAEGVAFADALKGKSGSVTLKADGVDGITGATISSKAAVSAVNAALECVAAMNA
ncbi:MAG: FMN-binding protein [Faecalibacterium sp.]|nr:FMN-binding protein [Faecalibacterium sp.]